MTYLLDTHVFVWFREGNDSRLGPKCVAELNRAISRGEVFVSAVSFREIAQLEQRGFVAFPGGAREWLRKAIDIPGATLVDIDPWTAFESASLHGLHRDPWDQLLAATSLRLGTSFVTRDRLILNYARKARMPVLDASR
jgi:PIN domain nuclease of toxin-antitoxin system